MPRTRQASARAMPVGMAAKPPGGRTTSRSTAASRSRPARTGRGIGRQRQIRSLTAAPRFSRQLSQKIPQFCAVSRSATADLLNSGQDSTSEPVTRCTRFVSEPITLRPTEFVAHVIGNDPVASLCRAFGGSVVQQIVRLGGKPDHELWPRGGMMGQSHEDVGIFRQRQ